MKSKMLFVCIVLFLLGALVSGQDTECQANEQYVSCGTACPETCETVMKASGEPLVCTMQCVNGCFCKDGFVRNNFRNNECVQRDVCRQSLQRDGGQNSGQSVISNLFVSSIAFLLIKIFH